MHLSSQQVGHEDDGADDEDDYDHLRAPNCQMARSASCRETLSVLDLWEVDFIWPRNLTSCPCVGSSVLCLTLERLSGGEILCLLRVQLLAAMKMESGVTRWLNKWLCRTQDLMTQGLNPINSLRVFSSQKCCADSLSVCPIPVCIRKHKNDHVRTLKILWSMSEFGGLWQHEKTQHALYWQKDKCTSVQ